MNRETLIETLKTHYPREVRKQLIKTILQHERDDNRLELTAQYKIINQIFSYVLHESGWRMGENSQAWDSKPLEVMSSVFPQIEDTEWYREQNIQTTQNVNIVMES